MIGIPALLPRLRKATLPVYTVEKAGKRLGALLEIFPKSAPGPSDLGYRMGGQKLGASTDYQQGENDSRGDCRLVATQVTGFQRVTRSGDTGPTRQIGQA